MGDKQILEKIKMTTPLICPSLGWKRRSDKYLQKHPLTEAPGSNPTDHSA